MQTDFSKPNENGSQNYLDNWFLKEWFEGEKKGYIHYILITASRLRKGKTALAVFLLEMFARLHGYLGPVEDLSKYIVFDIGSYISLWKESPEWSVIVLDEPNRAAGHRKWHTEENQDFAEFLQTTAYQHKHALLPLPSSMLVDNAVEDVVTANLIVKEPGFASVYVYDRDLLNRTHKTFHYFGGSIRYPMPSPKLWHAYEKKRHEYTMKRVEMILNRVQARQKRAEDEDTVLPTDDLLDVIVANVNEYRGTTGKISPVKIASKLKGVSWYKAQLLAARAREKIAEN